MDAEPQEADERGDFAGLWVAGAVLAQILVCHKLLRLEGEAYEWAQYILLATLLPAILAVFVVTRPRWPAMRSKLHFALAAVVIAGVCRLAAGQKDHLWLVAAVAQGTLAAAVARRYSVGVAVTGMAAWAVAVHYLFWSPLTPWVTESAFAKVVFGIAVVAVPIAINPIRKRELRPFDASVAYATGLNWRRNIAALALIAWVCSRLGPFYATDEGPLGVNMFHHWGAIVGPAEMVRNGGWLLWDTPSQYGFLSTLTLTWLPVRSAWDALYLVNGVFLWFAAAFLFFLMRSLGRGIVNYALALATALAAVCLIPGVPEQLLGPQITPAVGGFRFGWCFVLLAVLAWEFRDEITGRVNHGVPRIGCVVWLLGTLWSAESAVYCGCIWAPSYLLIVYRRWSRAPSPPLWANMRLGEDMPAQSGGHGTRIALLWMALPLALLATALGFIVAWYRVSLGHGPDWRAFRDYANALAYFAYPIDHGGAVWVLVMVYAVGATSAVALARPPFRPAALAFVLGSLAAFWATASYFVGRSVEVNATNLTPFILTAATVPLFVMSRLRHPTAALIRAVVLPLVTIILSAAYANRTGLESLIKSLRECPADISTLMPAPPDSLRELAETAGVEPADPVVYIDDRVHPNLLAPRPLVGDPTPLLEHRTWLPTAPLVLYQPLPAERQRLYLERFTARTALGGWLIEPVKPSVVPLGWLREHLRQHHRPTQRYQNAEWIITWYEPID
jgi:hypothetical protein